MPMATAAHADGAGSSAAPAQAGTPATNSHVHAEAATVIAHETSPAQPSTTAAGCSNDSAGIQAGAPGVAPQKVAGPPGKAPSSVAAAAQQRHADLAAAASRRAAEGSTAPSGSGKSGSAQPSGKIGGSSGGGGQQRHSGCNSQPPPAAAKPKRPLMPEEVERRAKRRTRHEKESAVRRRLELQRRVADVTSELEVLQNEVGVRHPAAENAHSIITPEDPVIAPSRRTPVITGSLKAGQGAHCLSEKISVMVCQSTSGLSAVLHAKMLVAVRR